MLPAGPQLRRLAPAPRIVRHDRHPDLRRRRPLRPAELQRQAPPGHERAALRGRAPFHPGPSARRDHLQGPPRRADHPAARRAGLRRRRARHPRPRRRRPGRPAPPVHHLRGNRVGVRLRESVQHRRAGLPLAAPRRPPQRRPGLETAAAPRRAARAARPPLRRRVHLRPAPGPETARRQDSHHQTAARGMDRVHPRRPPRIHHRERYEANLARLAANAARTAPTAPPVHPAKAPRCCKASSSAAAAATG